MSRGTVAENTKGFLKKKEEQMERITKKTNRKMIIGLCHNKI